MTVKRLPEPGLSETQAFEQSAAYSPAAASVAKLRARHGEISRGVGNATNASHGGIDETFRLVSSQHRMTLKETDEQWTKNLHRRTFQPAFAILALIADPDAHRAGCKNSPTNPPRSAD